MKSKVIYFLSLLAVMSYANASINQANGVADCGNEESTSNDRNYTCCISNSNSSNPGVKGWFEANTQYNQYYCPIGTDALPYPDTDCVPPSTGNTTLKYHTISKEDVSNDTYVGTNCFMVIPNPFNSALKKKID